MGHRVQLKMVGIHEGRFFLISLRLHAEARTPTPFLHSGV
jgi:hypothetical protein